MSSFAYVASATAAFLPVDGTPVSGTENQSYSHPQTPKTKKQKEEEAKTNTYDVKKANNTAARAAARAARLSGDALVSFHDVQADALSTPDAATAELAEEESCEHELQESAEDDNAALNPSSAVEANGINHTVENTAPPLGESDADVDMKAAPGAEIEVPATLSTETIEPAVDIIPVADLPAAELRSNSKSRGKAGTGGPQRKMQDFFGPFRR